VGVLLLCALATAPRAQESPYFVTYDHHLEEPGSLEVEYYSTFGSQRGGNPFIAPWLELEYGATTWWTTELYLDSQTTFHDSTVFTGFRWENRFRLLDQEHPVNPVLYVEYENITGADKILKEIEGNDVASDFLEPNGIAGRQTNHELELKLILSSDVHSWNLAFNPLFVKNLGSSDPWEFGYAAGISRPLAVEASPQPCSFCRENFIAGVEIYGGLGTAESLGLPTTSHYLAPVVAWNLPSGWTVHGSVGFGLNGESHGLLIRWGLSREFSGFGRLLGAMLGDRP
jgi:hypothetical protein